MNPLIIPAGIAAIGSLAGGLIGKSGQDKANEMNLQIAREQMAFQERMSGTAHQRAVQDLKQAGLNPALAYGGHAGGASTPSGSSARFENPNAQLAGNMSILAQTLASAQLTSAQAMRTRAEADVAQVDAQNRGRVIDSEIGLRAASAQQASMLAQKAEQELFELQQTWPSRKKVPELDVVHRRLSVLLESGTVNEKIRAAKLVNLLSEAKLPFEAGRSAVMAAVARVLGPYLDTAAHGSEKLRELYELLLPLLPGGKTLRFSE